MARFLMLLRDLFEFPPRYGLPCSRREAVRRLLAASEELPPPRGNLARARAV